MKISDLGEFGLIGRIQKLAPRKSSSTLIGIGDDAAALKLSASSTLLVTTDLLLEGVHFDLSYMDFFSLGWKAAAVNLSDIAAMGGIPRFCLTALGEVEPKRIITRAGARPGDKIYVTGTLGDSAAGLELLRNAPDRDIRGQALCGMRNKKSDIRNPKSEIQKLIARHLRPVPRAEWGRKLALSGCASAMIDLSDGLSSDLFHICEQSGVGAEISADRIPLSDALHKLTGKLAKPAVHYALSGGEDYELLFTAPPGKVKKLRSLKLPLTEIGLITPGKTLLLVDNRGRKKPLLPTGYDHFGKRRAVK